MWMEWDSPCPKGHLSNIMWLTEQYLYPATFNILDEMLVPVTVWFIDTRRSLTEWSSWIIHISYQCSDLSEGLRRMFRPPQEEVGESEISFKYQTVKEKSEILILFKEKDMVTQEKDFFISLWTGCRFSALQQTFLFCNATKCEYGEN